MAFNNIIIYSDNIKYQMKKPVCKEKITIIKRYHTKMGTKQTNA